MILSVLNLYSLFDANILNDKISSLTKLFIRRWSSSLHPFCTPSAPGTMFLGKRVVVRREAISDALVHRFDP